MAATKPPAWAVSCTGAYFEYQDLRARGEALRLPRIWMVSGEERAWPGFVDEALVYKSDGTQAGHPYQLQAAASLIAEEYAAEMALQGKTKAQAPERGKA